MYHIYREQILNLKIPTLITPDHNNQDILIPGLVMIASPRDGSCLFHSVLRAFNLDYVKSDTVKRNQLAIRTRHLLANALVSIDPKNGLTYYQTLANGNLAALGREFDDYSLGRLQKMLYSTNSVGNEFIEALSDIFDLDIYIIDTYKKDVYILGNNSELHYKNRRSIVLAYTQIQDKHYDDGHYDVIGLNTSKGLYTLFAPDFFLIRSIKNRIERVVKRS